jgi:hypothetical protein
MPSPAKRAPAGRHTSRELSPRWGSMWIVALRFYKYVAPLGLKYTFLIAWASPTPSERDSSGTTRQREAWRVMERIARREPPKAAKRLAQIFIRLHRPQKKRVPFRCSIQARYLLRLPTRRKSNRADLPAFYRR